MPSPPAPSRHQNPQPKQVTLTCCFKPPYPVARCVLLPCHTASPCQAGPRQMEAQKLLSAHLSHKEIAWPRGCHPNPMKQLQAANCLCCHFFLACHPPACTRGSVKTAGGKLDPILEAAELRQSQDSGGGVSPTNQHGELVIEG